MEVDVTINVESVKASASSATRLEDVVIDVPVVDTAELKLDNEIYGFRVVPVTDQEKEVNDETIMCVAINPILTESLAKLKSKPGFVTVNGDIHIPLKSGSTRNIEEVYVESEAHAKLIAKAITEVELERANEKAKETKAVVDFLKEQLQNERF